MEEAAAARKRKRDGEAAAAAPTAVSGEAGLGGAGCSPWEEAELALGEEELEGEDRHEGVAVEEVMRWLEAEISFSGKGGGGDDGGGFGFVTINGNEESCGPSFSAAASTVMAAVDTRAAAPPPPTPIPWPWPEPCPARDDKATAKATAAKDEFDEEWLMELLTAGGPALEVFSLD